MKTIIIHIWNIFVNQIDRTNSNNRYGLNVFRSFIDKDYQYVVMGPFKELLGGFSNENCTKTYDLYAKKIPFLLVCLLHVHVVVIRSHPEGYMSNL